MIRVSKRFADRAKANLRRFQKILEGAKARDVNESDTSVIVSDFLAEILGYDKYAEVTREHAIRGTFCDLAVRVGGHLQFLIEVKSIGTDLRDIHLRQALDYAAKEGVEWVLLTNGTTWQAHRLRFEQPVRSDHVFTVDLLDQNTKPAAIIDRLYLISREAAGGADIAQFHQHQEAVSRYTIGQLLLTEPVLQVLRRQLRCVFDGVRVTEEELAQLLRAEVLKREVLDGEKAVAAERVIRRSERKKARTVRVSADPVAPVELMTPEALPAQPVLPA